MRSVDVFQSLDVYRDRLTDTLSSSDFISDIAAHCLQYADVLDWDASKTVEEETSNVKLASNSQTDLRIPWRNRLPLIYKPNGRAHRGSGYGQLPRPREEEGWCLLCQQEGKAVSTMVGKQRMSVKDDPCPCACHFWCN